MRQKKNFIKKSQVFHFFSLFFLLLLPVCFAGLGLKWLVETVTSRSKDYRNYDPTSEFLKYVLAAIILDLLLAGSEIVHKLRLVWSK